MKPAVRSRRDGAHLPRRTTGPSRGTAWSVDLVRGHEVPRALCPGAKTPSPGLRGTWARKWKCSTRTSRIHWRRTQDPSHNAG